MPFDKSKLSCFFCDCSLDQRLEEIATFKLYQKKRKVRVSLDFRMKFQFFEGQFTTSLAGVDKLTVTDYVFTCLDSTRNTSDY